jgi:hypothetical protein
MHDQLNVKYALECGELLPVTLSSKVGQLHKNHDMHEDLLYFGGTVGHVKCFGQSQSHAI